MNLIKKNNSNRAYNSVELVNATLCYKNYINEVNFAALNQNEIKLMFFLWLQCIENESPQMCVSYRKIKKTLKCQNISNNDFTAKLRELSKRFVGTTYQIYSEDESGFTTIPIFIEFSATKNTKDPSLKVILHPLFYNYLNFAKETGLFTVVHLSDIMNLKSKNSIGLYMYCSQFRSTGKIDYCSIDKLKEIINVQPNTQTKRVLSRYLRPSLEELQNKNILLDYKVTYHHNKKKSGTPIEAVSIDFLFAKEIPKKQRETKSIIKELLADLENNPCIDDSELPFD